MGRNYVSSIFIVATCMLCFCFAHRVKPNGGFAIGQPIDSLHGVIVYYNGAMDNVTDRNLTPDNYNLGLKYQCVEFAKRYYYQHYNHKMPETYGNAKDFFDKTLADGMLNAPRNLTQYSNPSQKKPAIGDLVIYDATAENPYGHIAVVSKTTDKDIEIIQQNPGPNASTRARFKLTMANGRWKVEDSRVMGWLRKQ